MKKKNVQPGGQNLLCRRIMMIREAALKLVDFRRMNSPGRADERGYSGNYPGVEELLN